MEFMNSDVNGMGQALKKEELEFMARNKEYRYLKKPPNNTYDVDLDIIRDANIKDDSFNDRYMLTKVKSLYNPPRDKKVTYEIKMTDKGEEVNKIKIKDPNSLKERLKKSITPDQIKQKYHKALCNIYD